MRRQKFYVYIATNISRSALYIGVTSNISKRIEEHASGSVPSFTSKYKSKHLVYLEAFEDVYSALSREKQLKVWSRLKKEYLIMSSNPDWNDLGKNCL